MSGVGAGSRGAVGGAGGTGRGAAGGAGGTGRGRNRDADRPEQAFFATEDDWTDDEGHAPVLD